MEIKSYTTDEYIRMISDFCEWKGYTEKQSAYLMKPYVYEKDLFKLDAEDLLNLVIRDMCGNSQNPQYLVENRSYLSQFLSWAVDNGFIGMNPFDELDILSKDSMIKVQSEYVNLDILYPEDIRKTVSIIPQNKSYYAMLIYGFYEGIKGAKEFAEIKTPNIDLNNNTIVLKNRVFHGSEILFSYIRAYMKESEYVRTRNSPNSSSLVTDSIELIKVGEYLIKDKLPKNKDWKEYLDSLDMNKREYTLQKRISQDFCKGLPALFKMYGLKEFNYSVDLLNKSGFIDFARHKLYNFNDKEFCDVFVGTDNNRKKEWCKILEDIARDFGDITKGYTIRRNYRLHILNSKYYK